MDGEQKFKIDKGVPIPTQGGPRRKGYAAVLRQLKIGDSVVLPIPLSQASGNCQRILGTGKYVSRAVKGGTRIWRTA